MSALVVKLGGSSIDAPEHALWLDALASGGARPVVVPGGGPFADFVREAQQRHHFKDSTAHFMAILAMEQFGHLLLEREPRLVPVRTLGEIRNAASRGRASLWLPSPLAMWSKDIPVGWHVTSDSIAAWLADSLDCRRLLLIKQSDAHPEDVHHAAQIGLVDTAFLSMVAPGTEVWLAGPRDANTAAQTLAEGRIPGRRLVSAALTPAAC